MPKADIGKSLKRIWQLLELLPHRQSAVPKRVLHQRGCELHGWGVDEKTTQRDLEFLEEAKLAVRLNARPGDDTDLLQGGRSGYRWAAAPGKSPNTLKLVNTEDALAFHLIEGMAERLLPPEVSGALQSRREQARRKLEVERKVDPRARWADKVRIVPEGFALQAPKLENREILRKLQVALLEERVIKATHKTLHATEEREHLLEPRALWQSGTLLYVACTRAGKNDREPISWRLDRFTRIELTEDRIDARPFDLQTFLDQGGAQFANGRPRVEFRAWAHPEVWRRLAETPINATMLLSPEDPTGQSMPPASSGSNGPWRHVSAEVIWSEFFENWILQQGERLQVLGDAALRARIVGRLRTALEAYQA
ncbi:MAG: helix-turn-helix transcriptional regulator [Gammaproteobacteria bacterium]